LDQLAQRIVGSLVLVDGRLDLKINQWTDLFDQFKLVEGQGISNVSFNLRDGYFEGMYDGKSVRVHIQTPPKPPRTRLTVDSYIPAYGH
jgi:hypothetical protein